MKPVLFGPLACLAVGTILAAAASMSAGEDEPKKKGPAKAESGHDEWLAEGLREMQTVKPGMTRADVLKVFRVEGGLSSRTQRRYVYRGSPYIKVGVTFEPVGAPEDKLTESPQDKIVAISKPFLEWSIKD